MFLNDVCNTLESETAVYLVAQYARYEMRRMEAVRQLQTFPFPFSFLQDLFTYDLIEVLHTL